MSIEHLDELTFIAGNEQVFLSPPKEPFSPLVIEFLDELSKRILNSSSAKAFSDLITVAFYCRKGNIKKIQEQHGRSVGSMGRGLALHIAPSNVPMNFAYSLIFGLVSGNCNLVRLPSENYKQVSLFCEIYNEIIKLDKYQKISASNSIVTFSRDSLFLRNNASCFDLRVIWGGDKTVQSMRQYAWTASSKEIAFFDRYSLAIFDVDTILNMNGEQMSHLCGQFYNDTFLIDQNACSSPSLVYWYGKPDKAIKARFRFWSMLAEIVDSRYHLSMVGYIDKQVALLKKLEIYEIEWSIEKFGNSIITAWQENIHSFNDKLKIPLGFFAECSGTSLAPIIENANRKYQTLTQIGVNAKEIQETIIKSGAKGIDRIVPVGQALAMSTFWDGMDLIKEMTRIISIS